MIPFSEPRAVARRIERATVLPIAGISIIHESEAPLVLESSVVEDWVGSAETEPPIILRHAVGPLIRPSGEPTFTVEPWSTYYRDPQGETAVLFHSHASHEPEFLLETEVPGASYRVTYEFSGEAPLPRRDQELAAYTLALATRDFGVMAHGASFLFDDGDAALCLGVSGRGKSTASRLVSGTGRVHVINDDRQVLTRGTDGVHLWGTPWPGTAGIARTGDGRLGILAVIGRSETASVRPVSRRTAVATLMSTFALPLWDGDRLSATLGFVDDIVQKMEMVELAYPLGEGTGEWIVETLDKLRR